MIVAFTMLIGMLSAGGLDPVPNGARPSGIDEELTVNAIPTRVREWMLDLELSDARQFYRRFLGERHVELPRSQGLILAAPTVGGFTTVELLGAGPSRTRVRVSEARLASGEGVALEAIPTPMSIPVPVPPDARILSVVAGGRGAGRAQTLVARSASDLRSVAGFYERSLSAEGLRMTERRRVKNPQHPSELLSFIGEGRRVELVLTADAAQTWISAILSGNAR
jgi:hypothetical protein